MIRYKQVVFISLLFVINSAKLLAEECVNQVLEVHKAENVTTSIVTLPDYDLFKPLIASPRESQFSMRREYYDTHEGDFDAAVVSFGDYLPIVNYQLENEQVLQFSIDGSLYALFNLDKSSYDLINTDYFFGLSFSYLWMDGLTSRFKIYHGSSHLGDEYIIENPDFNRENSSYEDIEHLLSYNFESFRLYGGGGFVFRSNNEIKEDPLRIKGGLEFLHEFEGYEETALIFALDLESMQRGNWRLNNSVMSGVRLLKSNTKEVRLMFDFYTGGSHQGQFYKERLTTYGFGVYFIV